VITTAKEKESYGACNPFLTFENDAKNAQSILMLASRLAGELRRKIIAPRRTAVPKNGLKLHPPVSRKWIENATDFNLKWIESAIEF